jgi:CheY-like chemotaxis protein
MAGNGSAEAEADDTTEVETAAGENTSAKERADFLKNVPADIAKVREYCLAYIKAPTSVAKLEPLAKSVQTLNANASKAGYARMALLTKAFDMLLSKITAKPTRVTPSILQTLAEAADSLGLLLKSDEVGSSEPARAKVLAVDDDTVCNHVIVNTLKRANLDITSVEDPFEGLKLLQASHFDLVLLDIDMPKLTGFEVCEKLRSLPQYKTTPVIFVTAHSNFGNRTQGVLSGGNYFITKPVDPLELALKVTIHLFKAQVQHAGTPKPEVKPQAASVPEAPAEPPVPVIIQPSLQTNGNGNGNGHSNGNGNGNSHGNNGNGNGHSNGNGNGYSNNGNGNGHSNGNGNGNGSIPPQTKTEDLTTAAPLEAQPRPAATPEIASQPTPPELSSAPPVPITPFKNNGNGRGRNITAVPTLSVAPPVTPPSMASPANPHASNNNIPKVLVPLSSAPSLGESGTMNVNRISGSRNRNSIMNNEQDEAFEKVVIAVVRIIFGDDNLTEMNVRLVRIALERYNVHEVINSAVVA